MFCNITNFLISDFALKNKDMYTLVFSEIKYYIAELWFKLSYEEQIVSFFLCLICKCVSVLVCENGHRYVGGCCEFV